MTVTSGSAYLTIEESDGNTVGQCEFDDLNSCNFVTNVRYYFDGNTQVFSYDSSVNGFIIGVKSTDSSATMNLSYSWSQTVAVLNLQSYNGRHLFCF